MSDLQADDVRMRWSEDACKILGTLKFVGEPWTEYDPDGDNTGHFFVWQFDNKYAGTEVQLSANTVKENVIAIDSYPSTTTITLDSTCCLIQRIENLADGKLHIKMADDVEYDLDFTETTLEPALGQNAVVVASQEEDMDAVSPASTLIADDVAISWRGMKGTVTGTVHWYKFTNGHFAKKPTGHYLPVIVKNHDGETIKGIGSEDDEPSLIDPKWIIRVDDFITKGKNVKMYANDEQIAELDVRALKLELPVGENAIDATKKDYGQFGNNTAYYENGEVNLVWDGLKCTVTGKLNYVKTEQFDKLHEDGYYFAFKLNDADFEGKDVTVTLTKAQTSNATDWVMKITPESISKPITVVVDGITICTFDISGLTFGDAV